MQGQAVIKAYPTLTRWYDRMASFGHGEQREVTVNETLAAANPPPRTVPSELTKGAMLGKKVGVGPNDYGTAVTYGTVVGEDEHRWILSRETKTAGMIHVHFPKPGYQQV